MELYNFQHTNIKKFVVSYNSFPYPYLFSSSLQMTWQHICTGNRLFFLLLVVSSVCVMETKAKTGKYKN